MRFPVRDLLRKEFRQYLVAGMAVFSLMAFLAIGEMMDHGAIQRFDEGVLLAMRNWVDPAPGGGHAWLLEVMRDITSLGGVTVISLVTLVVLGFLLLRQERRLVLLVVVIVAGGALLETGLKMLYARTRPSVVSHLMEAHAGSFPSGHSMMSAVVYLSLAALLARVESSRRVRMYTLAVALVASGLIGVSRVYLGVHYPTDVLAGWSLGLAWSALCWIAGRSLREHPPGLQVHGEGNNSISREKNQNRSEDS